MKCPIAPLADRIVATRAKAENKTASGLFLPDNAKEKPVMAEVVAVGPEVSAVKIGDKILYKEYATTDVKINSVEYLIVKQEDVLGVIA